MKLNHTEEEIRALVDGATPGPWCRGSSVIGSLCVYGGGHGGNAGRYLIAQVDDIGGTGAADTRFIAAAPTIAADALAMHAEIARLRAENERIRARLARVVPVIEALDAWIVFGAKPTTREAALWLRMVDALAASLGLSDDDDYDTVRAAIRALIADEVPRG